MALPEGITLWGRPIHGPTLPGQGIRCKRETPLTPAEMEEVVEIISRARLEHRMAFLPERLRTRNWESIMPESARMGEQGRVQLTFRILRDGAVPNPSALEPTRPGLNRPRPPSAE